MRIYFRWYFVVILLLFSCHSLLRCAITSVQIEKSRDRRSSLEETDTYYFSDAVLLTLEGLLLCVTEENRASREQSERVLYAETPPI